jgi:hypothetical protein
MTKEIRYFVNGLPALYNYLKDKGREEEARSGIKNFLKSSFDSDLEEKVDRFLAIPGGLKPADMEYFKLYWELMQLYVNGLFYSTVVMSGILSERICYDLLSRQRIKVGDKEHLSEEQISCLYKMNLYDIIELLAKWGLIKTKTRSEMIEINNKRNRYVHPEKSSKLDAKKDSKEMIIRISKVLEEEFVVGRM